MYMLFMALSVFLSVGIVLLLFFLLSHLAYGKSDKRNMILASLFAFLFAGIFTVTGIPSVYSLISGSFDGAINLIPFSEVISSPLQYILNVILFIPVGLLLPITHPAFRQLKYAACSGFFLSLLIETLQLFNFRTTDINDLIANTLGAILGFAVINCWSEGFKRKGAFSSISEKNSFIQNPILLAAVAFCAVFFIEPLVENQLAAFLF